MKNEEITDAKHSGGETISSRRLSVPLWSSACSLFFIFHFSFCLSLASAAPYAQLQVPEHGAYTGAYVDFGDGEDGVADFAELLGGEFGVEGDVGKEGEGRG